MTDLRIILPYSNKTIYNSIAKNKNPLKILDLIDLFDGHKKIDIINSQRSGKNVFEVMLHNTLNKSDVLKLFQNIPTQVFLCSEIRLYLQEGEYMNKLIESEFTYDSTNNHLDFEEVNTKSEKYGIAFIGFKQRTFFRDFNKEDIVKYIKLRKSFNWKFNNKSITSLNLNHLTNIEKISRKKNRYDSFKFSKEIKSKDYSVSINFDFDKKDTHQNIIFHNGLIELLNPNYDFSVLSKKISFFNNYKIEQKNINKIISYHIEFKISNCEYNENYSIINTDKFIKLLSEIEKEIDKILSNSSIFKSIIEDASVFLKSQSVEKLTVRRDKIREAQKVFYKGQFIYKQPDNEQEVVMLFMILNSKGLTPFHYFNLLDYSTAEGIDAWADIQLFEDEMRSEKLVEFEKTFKKFISHGHSAKQVNIVVCWKIEKEYKDKFKKLESWLFESSDLKILIIEIASLPGVICKHE